MIITHYGAPFRVHDKNLTIITAEGRIFSNEEGKLFRVRSDFIKHSAFASPSLFLGLKELGFDSTLDIDEPIQFLAVGPETIFADRYSIWYALKEFIPIDISNIDVIGHHRAHAYQAVLTSNFENCFAYTLDNGGQDGLFGSLMEFSNGSFKQISSSKRKGLPWLYDLVSQFLFNKGAEGKLMGLAAYGKVRPELYTLFAGITERNGFFPELESSFVSARKTRFLMSKLNRIKLNFYKTPQYEHPVFDKFKTVDAVDLAATVQQFVEDQMVMVFNRLKSQFGHDYFAVSGGFFNNIKTNQRIRAEVSPHLHVPMGPSDRGLSLGAALYAYQKKTGQRLAGEKLSPYLGVSFSNEEIVLALEDSGLRYEPCQYLAKKAAKAIASGLVIGWFQGRAELGERALGARSVLADPRRVEVKARVNQILKRREWFMPYAPSILEEHAAEWLEQYTFSPYMTLSFKMKPDKAESIPAAFHVDQTIRPQIVRREMNEHYWELINAFREETGVPMVLNTSFNKHGFPIIYSPRDALELLHEGKVDALAIGSFWVEREYADHEWVCYPEGFMELCYRIEHSADFHKQDETYRAYYEGHCSREDFFQIYQESH